MSLEHVAEIAVDRRHALVAEQGWQSWTPSSTYRLDDAPARATTARFQQMCYRPGRPPAAAAFRGDGVLAIQPEPFAPVTVVAGVDPRHEVPRITAVLDGDVVRVDADGAVTVATDEGPDGVDGALARWADTVVAAAAVPAPRPAPTVWCSWYHYFTEVTEQDVDENVAAARRLGLPIDVVQIDDGHQAEIGDWLTPSDRFVSVPGVLDRIRDAGFGAGVWTAPFFVGERSAAFRDHPERLVRDVHGAPLPATDHWGQTVYALDTTHPSAEEWLHEVFTWFGDAGVGYHKIDFLYAAALPGVRHDDVDGITAYQRGLASIRGAIGEDAYLLGCGAPQLPSVGLVDAMRVSPDTEPNHRPRGDDLSQPSVLSATVTGRARAFMHGRFWINDPDCLIARPGVERRQDWAAHIAAFGGLRSSSDRLEALDEWGLGVTHELLGRPPADRFIPS